MNEIRAARWVFPAAAIAATLACVVAGLHGQQPAAPAPGFGPVTFRAEVNYVEVGAVVLDRQGRFVGGLRQDDFLLFEDGKPQAISTFSLVDMPATASDAPLVSPAPVDPDVASNVNPFEGRLYLLVLDDLHTSFSSTTAVKRAARQFIERFVGAGDLATLVSTSGRTDASQDLTASRQLLLRAADRFQGRSLPSATANRIESYAVLRDLQGTRVVARTAPVDRQDAERAYNARATLSAIRRLANLMGGVRGRRKALVLFSEGIDYNVANAITQGWAPTGNPEAPPMTGSGPTREVQLDTIDTIAAATRANVAIYCVDPRGLTAGAASVDLPTPPSDADPSLGLDAQAYQAEIAMQQDSLLALSAGSGGFAALNTSDFTSAFDRIRADNSTYYVLGYSPTNDRRDGRFRRIEVRSRRPGLDVRARKGYVAPRGGAATPKAAVSGVTVPPPLADALASPLPASAVRLSAFAAPFRGPSPKAAITLVLHVDGRDLTFTEENGVFNASIGLSVLALDSEGKTHDAVHRTIPMPLKPESYRLVSQAGIRIVARTELLPGRYQLRVAVMNLSRPIAGSVHYDLEVPDFEALPLSMSGLVLTSSRAGLVPTAGGSGVEELRGALPGPPTLAREFLVGEELALFAEVYDRETTTHTTDVTTTVWTDEGREVYRTENQHGSDEFAAGGGLVRHTARIRLQDVGPGLYTLRVEARSRLRGDEPVVRDVRFRVLEAEPPK